MTFVIYDKCVVHNLRNFYEKSMRIYSNKKHVYIRKKYIVVEEYKINVLYR